MADESPIGSPLSDLSSDAFDGDEEHERDQEAMAPMPPARKRQKLSDGKESASPPRFAQGDGDISSDSEGDLPNSPGGAYRFDEDDTHEQVTACIWEGCNAGEMGNMDKLVQHIHKEHIETRGKKYPCEWGDCARRGANHASAYALKAHMRSHTREKPFYCDLPECDRAFTRSDALAKHYRTVHETEALRPSDPIPKSMQQMQNRLPRTKPKDIMRKPNLEESYQSGSLKDPHWTSSYSEELGFTEEDEKRGSKELYRLLKRQIKWAEEDAVELKEKCEQLEKMRQQEWLEKELFLDQAVMTEERFHEDRRLAKLALPAYIPDSFTQSGERVWMKQPINGVATNPSSPAPMPLSSQPVQGTEETAAILASLHQVA